MKTAKIKVSIIVPAYNTAEYLPRCLDSLVRQTLKEIEIIVINNNSNDDGKTADVIKSYAERYPKLIVPLFCKKPGASAARNMGIRHAKGDFIGFADSDDYCELNMFEAMYKATKGAQDSIATCDIYLDSPNSTESAIWHVCDNREISVDKAYIISVFGPCSIIIWRQTMLEHKAFFNEDIIYEDAALMPSLVLYANHIYPTHRPFYHYVRREGSLMNPTGYNPKAKDIFRAMDNLRGSFIREEKFDYYRKEIEYIYIGSLLYNANNYFSQYSQTRKNQARKIAKIMKTQFPTWRHNPYFLQKDLRFRILCKLYYYRWFEIICICSKFKRIIARLTPNVSHPI